IDNDNIAADITLHLQGIGKYVCSLDILHYLEQPGVKQQLKIKKTPHLSIAKRWMRKMGYRWTKNLAGQYVDGHEHEDVVWYWQTIFLPAWQALGPGNPLQHHVVVWFHDGSTFYANDQ
ncbi:hypothetical protein BDN67DRAFT_865467, partial [Paxillus ammoniavirescens]